MDSSTITDLLFVPDHSAESDIAGYQSVGLVIDGKSVCWGDIPVWSTASTGSLPEPTRSTLRAELADKLVGLSLAAFDWQAWQTRLEAIDFNSVPGLRLGIEQALIASLAQTTSSSTAEVMARIFADSAPSSNHRTQLILEVENHQATAQVIESMIALGPDGIGYRLSAGDMVESIGTNAQYLQRFLRELTVLLAGRPNAARERPILYLGLNGALGALVADPRRDTGRLLGLCVGLEQVAGNLPVWLEDPIILDDEITHVATLHQLREFIRIRGMRTRLIGRAHADSLEAVQMFCETDAVDGLCLSVGEWGSLTALANAIHTLRSAGKLTVLAIDQSMNHSGLAFLLDYAAVLGVNQVLVDAGWGMSARANEARAHLERRIAWLDYVSRKSQ